MMRPEHFLHVQLPVQDFMNLEGDTTMNKKYWMTGMLALLLVFSAGCGQKPAAAPADTPEQTADVDQADPGDKAADQVNEEEAVEPVNAGAGEGTGSTASGGESTTTTTTTPAGGEKTPPIEPEKVDAAVKPEHKSSIKLYYTDPEIMELKETSREITYAGEEDKYKKAFEALQTSSDASLNPLWSDKITLKSLKFDQGALTLDISKPAEANLGAGGEMFAIDALQKTFFQFEEVKSIELLVDGQQIESLMGHVELEHPMTRN